eukprot:CCRYP_003821-RA/>CCRYP_003821-RA protein AED:0.34 eAED:0.63 QI:0/0/0/1/0/0/4/0/365
MGIIEFPSSNTKANGNLALLINASTPNSVRLTTCMTCHLSNNAFDGCMGFAVMLSNPHGLRPPKQATLLVVSYTIAEGNKYIMVMVEVDSNAILLKPMKSHKDGKMVCAFDTLVTHLMWCGVQPKKHVLDNEISENMKPLLNFKAHFLSVLTSTAASFPPSLLDCLLSQPKITINLFYQSNATPTVLVYAHLCGPFNCNKMPLAPMGCKVQIHEKTDQCGTWAYHCLDGWYLYTLPEHYCIHNCHMKTTKAKQLSDSVHFHHKHITNPSLAPANKLMQASLQSSPIRFTGHHQLTHKLTNSATSLTSPTPNPIHPPQQNPRTMMPEQQATACHSSKGAHHHTAYPYHSSKGAAYNTPSPQHCMIA